METNEIYKLIIDAMYSKEYIIYGNPFGDDFYLIRPNGDILIDTIKELNCKKLEKLFEMIRKFKIGNAKIKDNEVMNIIFKQMYFVRYLNNIFKSKNVVEDYKVTLKAGSKLYWDLFNQLYAIK